MFLKEMGAWPLSLIGHAFVITFIYVLLSINVSKKETIEIPVVVEEGPKEAQVLSQIQEKPRVVLKSINPSLEEKKSGREVFGVSRQSHSDSSEAEGIEAKMGNTVSKEADRTQLTAEDSDSLPTPTEEYLVSEMPVVVSEVRPVYPKEARDRELEGVVVMDILIDDKGKVRDVSVVDGESIFLKASVEAIKKFLFKPALVEGRPVPVRIRYSLKFQLEY